MTALKNPGGRPRKYASDAERQAAFRNRWAVINVRCEPRTKETVSVMAAVADFSDADIVSAAIKFYALNYDGWRTGDIFGGRLPTVLNPKDAERIARMKKPEGNDDGNDN